MTRQVPGQGFEQAMMLFISDLLQSFLKSLRQSLIIILNMPLSASYSFLGNLTACYLVRELVIITLCVADDFCCTRAAMCDACVLQVSCAKTLVCLF